MPDENEIKINEKTIDAIVVLFKDGRVKPSISLSLDDLKGIYEKWEYGGFADPVGQLGAWIVNTLSSAIDSVKSGLELVIRTAISGVLNAVNALATTISGAISSIVGAVKSFIDALYSAISNILSQISSAISRAISIIQSGISLIIDNVKAGIASLTSLINTVLSNLSNIANTIVSVITSSFNQLISSITAGLSAIKDILSSLIVSITNTLKTIADTLLTTLQTIGKTFSEISQAILSFLRDTLTQAVNKMTETLGTIYQSISSIVQQVSKIFSDIAQSILTTLRDVFNQISTALSNIGATIMSFIGTVIDTIKGVASTIWDYIQKGIGILSNTISYLFQKVLDVINAIAGALRAFTNPLAGILAFFESIFKPVLDGIRFVINGITWVATTIRDYIHKFIDFFKTVFDRIFSLFTMAGGAIEWLKTTIGQVLNPQTIIGGILWVAEGIKSVISTVISTITSFMISIGNAVLNFVLTMMRGILEGLTAMVKTPFNFGAIPIVGRLFQKLPPEQQTLLNTYMSETTLVIDSLWKFGLQILFSTPVGAISAFVVAILAISELLGVFDSLELAFRPIIAEARARINFKTLKNATKKFFEKLIDEAGKTFFFTFSFWLFEPVKYILNPLLRGWLPIEIPTLHEIIEITRRYLPDNSFEVGSITPRTKGSVYTAIELQLYDVIAKRGYPTWFDSIITTGYNNYAVVLLDRFDRRRVIPSAMLFALPPPSDCVRMMLRDMIQNLDDFGKLMLMHGFHPDVSALYFMLHFRYPSTERIFEYACRVASGVVWVDRNEPALSEYFRYLSKEESNYTKWGLGFKPKTPKEISDIIESKYPLTDLTRTTEIASKRVSEAFSPLGIYFKWHDLFPMAWINGQTSDQMIAMELSADIPMRIDARWMYKWGVISEEDVVRIVIARGMHPKWVENIAIAEMMNAMAEERTIVRTGIMNSFKEGFFNEENLSKQLSNLTTIRLLDRDVPVRFLEGEVKLMTLRSKYDRALDILLNAQKSLFTAYAENIIEYEQVKTLLKTLTEKVAKELDIPLYFDEIYYETYKAGLDVRQTYETISRIRRYLRYAIIEVMNRVRSGYLSENEIKESFKLIQQHARLTDADVEYFVSLALLMRSQFERQIKVQAILKKLSKGLILKEDALKELINLGIEEDIAESMIEVQAKTYTLSIAQYLSYANYIDIPVEWLEKKLDLLGVPDDEKQLILSIFEIKPISNERDSLVKRYLDEFESGYIDEKTVRTNLSRLGVLPKSVDLLIEMKKVEKSMNAKKLLVDATLNKLKRGVMRLDEAIAELKKYIVDENLIYALIEKNVRTYTFSPDKMISMSEYVPIDLNWLIEKARTYGYPEEEVRLFPAYAVAREISEEMKRLANELGQAFAEGVITEDDYKKALDELATLGGQAKAKFGVDWIVLSPEERYTLIQLYKIRAVRKLYSETKQSTTK